MRGKSLAELRNVLNARGQLLWVDHLEGTLYAGWKSLHCMHPAGQDVDDLPRLLLEVQQSAATTTSAVHRGCRRAAYTFAPRMQQQQCSLSRCPADVRRTRIITCCACRFVPMCKLCKSETCSSAHSSPHYGAIWSQAVCSLGHCLPLTWLHTQATTHQRVTKSNVACSIRAGVERLARDGSSGKTARCHGTC